MASNLPAAWKECTSKACPAATPPEKNSGGRTSKVGMKNTPSTCGRPCYCVLFSAPKNSANPEWTWEENSFAVAEADKKQFQWICVEPVFEGSQTSCSKGDCMITTKKKTPDGPQVETVTCSSPTRSCESPCKCTPFRLKVSGRDAKWEEQDQGCDKEPGYAYECFCVKQS